jgi:hypothetical protein
MRDRKPIPRNQSEVTQIALDGAYLASQGRPTSDSIAQRHQNRAAQTTRKTDKVKDISIGLHDIDHAIKYYFETIIKPTVIQDGQRMNVPVMYASPERWKSVQQDGYYRDTNGKLVLPIIMYKRDSVEKNRTLGNKIDGNLASLFQVFETRYNQRNAYDRFSVINNRIPSKQYYVSVVPDYVTITYTVSIFTNYVEQNNKIIEAVEFASDSYWGDENRWHFRTSLDSFSTTNIINSGEDKAAVTTVTLKVNGYLISDSINSALADTSMHYSPAQVVFGLETVENVNAGYKPTSQIASAQSAGATSFIGSGNGDIAYFSAPSPLITGQSLSTTSFVGDGLNVTNEYQSYTGLTPEDLAYISTNVSKTANIITNTTATFTGASFLEPSAGSQLPPTSISNFTFYANSLPISYNEITGWGSDGMGNLILTIDPTALGYYLTNNDNTNKTIIAVGKFA